jgi:DUF4097 and DUF4098 domain-containing protein YvlB
MNARKLPLAALVLILTSTAALAQANQGTQTADSFDWKGALAAGKTLEIRGVNGDIRATAAAGNEASVTARKTGRDRADVRIEVVEHADGVTICAVYPSRRERDNYCAPGGGRNNVEDIQAEVDFTVTVPKSVVLQAATVNGDVNAEGLGSFVNAKTVNGSVSVSTAHWAEAKTVNGSVRVRMGRADWTGTLEFATVNGDVELELPSDLNASVETSSVNGDMRTDFPLTVRGRFRRHQLSGTIGSGGRDLKLKTVNGDMVLRKATL